MSLLWAALALAGLLGVTGALGAVLLVVLLPRELDRADRVEPPMH
jgi:hypothetical protein